MMMQGECTKDQQDNDMDFKIKGCRFRQMPRYNHIGSFSSSAHHVILIVETQYYKNIQANSNLNQSFVQQPKENMNSKIQMNYCIISCQGCCDISTFEPLHLTVFISFTKEKNWLKQSCLTCAGKLSELSVNLSDFPFLAQLQSADTMTNDYKQMFEDKCNQFQQLNDQFTEYQEQSNFIITDLEEQIKELKKKTETQNKQLTELKEKRKNFNHSYQKEIEQTKKQREQFRTKFVEFEKKVIGLENINECLQSDLRACKASLFEYEQRIQKTMEQLALLQMQMEQNTESNQEQIARLRSQVKETEDELYAWQFKHQKGDNQFQSGKENHEESFQSKHSIVGKRSQMTESKVKRRNPKFGKTLAEIRSYIHTISTKREEISKKLDELQ